MTPNQLYYEIELGNKDGQATATARIRHRHTGVLMIDKVFTGDYHDVIYDEAEGWAQGWIQDYHDDAADAAHDQRALRRMHDDYPEYPGA